MKVSKLLPTLKIIRESSDMMITVYTNGSCFRLYKLIKILYPKAEAYWSDIDNHCITKVDGGYYDIGGKVADDYMTSKSYFKINKKHLHGYSLLKYSTDENRNSIIVERYESS